MSAVPSFPSSISFLLGQVGNWVLVGGFVGSSISDSSDEVDLLPSSSSLQSMSSSLSSNLPPLSFLLLSWLLQFSLWFWQAVLPLHSGMQHPFPGCVQFWLTGLVAYEPWQISNLRLGISHVTEGAFMSPCGKALPATNQGGCSPATLFKKWGLRGNAHCPRLLSMTEN